MWQDPIVTETRALRDQYASQFGHQAEAIFQDILRRQSEAGKKLVSFPPRRPVDSATGVSRQSAVPLQSTSNLLS
jgi:hypothetical protein